jgi:DNA-binding Xre family transcriptional regulator
MTRKTGYVWHLRRLMAEHGMFATTELVPLLAMRGVALSREQVYRLVTGTPERLSLTTLAALCDILGCGPGDLVEPVTSGGAAGRPGREPGARSAGPARPRRAQILPGPGQDA